MKYTLALFALAHLVYFNVCKPNNLKPSLRLCLQNGPLENTTVDCDRSYFSARKSRTYVVECTKVGKHPAVECDQYYECVKINWFLFSFWQARLNNCPEGKAFDVEANDCEPAERVDCQKVTTSLASTVEDIVDLNTKKVEVVPPECKKAGKHPAVECNQYYECVNPIWWMIWIWEAKLDTCPLGQAFDVKTNDCKAAALVNCLTDLTTTASTVASTVTGVEVSSTDVEIFTTNKTETEKSSESTPTTVDSTFQISTVSSTESEIISEINGVNNSTIANGSNVSTVDSTFNQSTSSTLDVEIFTTNETGTGISEENYPTIEDSTTINSTFEISTNNKTSTDLISTILTTIYDIFTSNEIETGEISTADSTFNLITDSITTDFEMFTADETETKENGISSKYYSAFDMSTVSTITNKDGTSTVDSIFNESIISTTAVESTTNVTETKISSENYSTIENSSSIYSTFDISTNTDTSTTAHEIFTTNEVGMEETDSTMNTKNQNEESTTVKLVNIFQNANNMSKVEISTSSTVSISNSSTEFYTTTKNENTKNVDSSTNVVLFDNGTSSIANTIFADSTSNGTIDANISTVDGFSEENKTSFSANLTTPHEIFTTNEVEREETDLTMTTKNQNEESTTVNLVNIFQNTNNMSKVEISTSSTVSISNNTTKNENTKNVDSSTSVVLFDNGTSSTASTIFADSTSNGITDANISTVDAFSDENTTSFSVTSSTKFNNSEKHRESTEETTVADGTDSRIFVISFKKLLLFNIITYLLLIK